jgi:hypothetical protein
MTIEVIAAPSTLANWGPAVCLDDSFGPDTFPRSVICSFAIATSSMLTVAGKAKTCHDNPGCRTHSLHPRDRVMRRSNRPIIERLPCLRLRDIVSLIPRDPNAVYNLDTYGLRYPGKVSITAHSIKITDAAIVPQCFRLEWIKSFRGQKRPLIVCQCRRKAKVLYHYQGRYACRRCHNAEYQSQHLSKARQRLWKAARLRIELNGAPNDYQLPSRPRYRHRKRYLRLTDCIVSLEAQARKAKKREIDTRLYAYHLA